MTHVSADVEGPKDEPYESNAVAKAIHTDGTVDYIDAGAIGGDVQCMPKGYFRSPPFVGTVLVSRSQHYAPCLRGSANLSL